MNRAWKKQTAHAWLTSIGVSYALFEAACSGPVWTKTRENIHQQVNNKVWVPIGRIIRAEIRQEVENA